MKAFYGARFSPHMTKTPEGFLVCHSVPICRTGVQQYLPKEIGVDGDKLVDVYRMDEEVFKPSAMASFEGKPVTDEHPPQEVDPSNFSAYTKGCVQNVRRGTDSDADKLVCDLVIYDANLIGKIDGGKREISCGYDCKYIDNGDGTYHQADIVGNHVAVVTSGRAGHEVSIKDSNPKGVKKMAKKKSIFQRMYDKFVQDADPDEIREASRAVDAVENGDGPDNEPPEDDDAQTTHDEDMQMVMQAIHDLNEKVEELSNRVAKGAHDDEPKEPELKGLDALEAQLAGNEGEGDEPDAEDDDNEESVTVSPEELNEDSDEEAEGDEPPQDAPDDQQAQDRALSLAMLRTIKPYIARMPRTQRKRATDALTATVKKAMKVKGTQTLPGGYGALTGRRRVSDSLAKQGNPRAFGENCLKRNPHYKGGK